MAETAANYDDFINEAFIKPIRSVLIVDDEYPTIENVLSVQIERQKPIVWNNAQRILNVIQNFRERDPALIVDVHNGEYKAGSTADLANHLHQSDLLILDYELQDSGEKAVEIVNKVLSNNHFNLIVLHTNEEILTPFTRILLSMLNPDFIHERCQVDIQKGLDLITEKEYEDPAFIQKLRNAISLEQYLHARNDLPKAIKAVFRNEEPFNQFSSLAQDLQGHDKKALFIWSLNDYEVVKQESFNKGEAIESLRFSYTADEALWLRTNQGFITFVHKQEDVNLIDELLKGLKAWKPSPSRLLSSKLRVTLDDEGVLAEDLALSGRYVHAKFYHHLLNAQHTDALRSSLIDSQINTHIETLTSHIKDKVRHFVTKLISDDLARAQPDLSALEHYGVDLSQSENRDRASKEYNSYVSCKPLVTGWHLETGHIFEYGEEVWVCLSPICDLVPGQKDSGVYGDVGSGRKPFVAVKLHKQPDEKPADINSNNYVFLRNNSQEIDIYSFYGKNTSSATPQWSIFIADDNGILNQTKSVKISRIQSVGTEMVFCTKDCQLIAQLRYEYALNLLQKLGFNFTRVGLDFNAH